MSHVLMSYIHYPLSVGKFFKAAFKRLGHEVWSAGPCSHGVIPWQPQTDFSHYADIPDHELWPISPYCHPLSEVLGVCPWTPDVIVEIDAGFYLEGGYEYAPIALVATDPHSVDYHKQSMWANAFCVMQHCYMKSDYTEGAGRPGSGPIPLWLPYCYDPETHYWDPRAEKEWDVCFIGMLEHPDRVALLDQLTCAGIETFKAQGILFEEGTAFYNRSRIALNRSTLEDLPMRFWEGMAYRCCVVTSRVPDLKMLEGWGCKEGQHYLAYDTHNECVEVIRDVLADPERLARIADAGYVWVQQHTYERRAQAILDSTVGRRAS